MNKRDIVRYNSHKKAGKFMEEHDSKLSLVTTYGPVKFSFDKNFTGVEEAFQKQGINIIVITNDKSSLKRIMGNTVFTFVNKGCVQAGNLNMTELEQALDVTLYSIIGVSDEEAKNKAIILKDLLKTNQGVLTEVKAADILLIERTIDDFSAKQVEPEEKISFKKTQGTDQIAYYLKLLDKDRKRVGKIIQAYTPEDLQAWKDVIKIGKSEGTRKMSLVLNYKDMDTNVPLQKVKATAICGDESIVKYSSKKGRVTFYSLTIGTWQVRSEHPQYNKEESGKLGIDDKHIEKLNVKLRPVLGL
jgi:hypothetical protein